MTRGWFCSVGWTLTGRDGAYCGYVGSCMPAESQEDAWDKGLAYLRRGLTGYAFLVHTFELRTWQA